METESNETTRTDRRGWRERTLEESSCTQIERAMRCAMETSSNENSRMPDTAACVVSEELLTEALSVPRALASSRFMAAKSEGIAASTTERPSTVAMSSSSDRCASFAASSSSVAIPKDTENARSELSDPSAPAVLMPPPAVPLRAEGAVSTSDVRWFSQEGGSLAHPQALAWQAEQMLTVRRLLLSPIVENGTPGRGGKAQRVRIAGTHHHGYSGCVFGCLLSNAVQFARGGRMRTSDALQHLHRCLEPPGCNLESCTGADAAILQRGFASRVVIRRQLQLLPECRSSQRIDSKYGRKSVALGISAAVFYALSCAATDSTSVGGLRVNSEMFVGRALSVLQRWPHRVGIAMREHGEELDAEKRALTRGLLALKVGKKRAEDEGLDLFNGVLMELAFMSRGMWPHGKILSAESQPSLCEWIHTGGFVKASRPPQQMRPERLDVRLPIPLAQLHELPRWGETSSDTTSDTGGSTTVSLWSSSAASSTEGQWPGTAEQQKCLRVLASGLAQV